MVCCIYVLCCVVLGCVMYAVECVCAGVYAGVCIWENVGMCPYVYLCEGHYWRLEVTLPY